MNFVIREKRRSVSENSPTLSAFSVATISRQHVLVVLGRGLHDAPVGELQADAAHEVAVAVERLVEGDPALGPAPVRAREDLEARDVAAAAADPLALLAEQDAQIDVLADDVQPLDRQRVQPLHVVVDLAADLAPARDRVGLVEEARVDDLLPVLRF